MWKLAVSFCLLTTIASADVSPETYTFAILRNQKPKCLGVAVDEKYIATSAHCVYGTTASSLVVNYFNRSGDNGVPVMKVFVHPYYTPPSPDYDIALLKINPIIPLTGKMPPGKKEPLPSEKVETIYWDRQNHNISLGSIKIEDRKSCKNKVGKFVSGRMICAYDENPSLKSDGPLIFAQTLIGIHSKNIESNQGVLPAIYTNIANSEIYSFIESYV